MLLFYLASSVYAQQQPLSETEWQELTEGVDYNEKAKEPASNSNFRLPKFNIDANIVKFVFFGLVLSVLIFILVRYLMSLQGISTNKQDIQVTVNSLREAEENPMQANLVGLIEKLVAEKKYREATRAYFLLVLQRMHHGGYIIWKKPKTNFDYVNEVTSTPFKPIFSTLTYYFELIWYGSQPVSEKEFREMEPQFVQLLKQLHKDE